MKQQEALLVQCAEEASELAQAFCKALRFGFFNKHEGQDNFCRIQQEFNDLIASMMLLDESINGTVSIHAQYPRLIEAKKTKITQLLELSRTLGTVQ